jgi:hypothetical protein
MTSREENEAVAGLLRRSLARDAVADACPEPEFLAAYFEHSLDAAETARYDQHFSGCSRCREQLAAMVRADVPKPQPRTAWLLDWRLLTAAAVVLLLVTVWLVRKPEKANLASQPASGSLVAEKDEPKSGSPATTAPDRITAMPQAAPETAKKVEPALTAPAPRLRARDEARRDDQKAAQQQLADSNALAIESAPKRVPGAQSSNQRAVAQTGNIKQQQSLTNQAVLGGALPRGTVAGHAGGAQQQQQIAPTSQMVMVEPSPAPAQSASAAPESAPVNGRNVPSASQPARPAPSAPASSGAQAIGSASETVTVTADEISNDKKDSQPLASAYSTSGQGAMLQILAERSVATVIDTPIPAIKWRITTAGFVERSEDGGATWKGQEPDPAAHLVAGSAPTDKVCWLVGSEGVVLVTKDATNWKKIPPPVTGDLTAVSAKSASAATITTADGRRFSTHNEGKKWKPEN